MPFSYYARLARAQQTVYRKSDGITEVRLDRPDRLHPLVAGLEAALRCEERVATQTATEGLIRGLTDALGIPPVRVEVLAARPHAKWGELHGLYTAAPGRPSKIQLWMRTAKQKRVVAFRTFLRTLLHEVGHHVDYTLLRLPDSFHTEGFYKRESSLFYQLVPERRNPMASIEEYASLPVDERLARLARTADDLVAAIRDQTDAAVSKRPDAKNWSAKEVVCHLRDAEELFMDRFTTIMAMADPALAAATPERWAEERQYSRDDAHAAFATFRKRRVESLEFLKSLPAEAWKRAGIHATRGKITIDDLVSHMAWHDDNHLDQLKRALAGKA